MKLIRSKKWFKKRIDLEGDSEIGAGTIRRLPKKIIRLEDGMEFLLNESTGQYRIHLGIPHLDDPKYLHNEYTYERLMEDPRSKGMFKVSDGTEDIGAMKRNWNKQWLKSIRCCGEDDECGKGRE